MLKLYSLQDIILSNTFRLAMHFGAIDQSKMIQEMRKRFQDLLSDPSQQDDEISFALSQSQHNMEQRLRPFVNPLRGSGGQTRKRRATQQNYNYASPYNQKILRERSTSASNRQQGTSVRRKIFAVYDQHKKNEEQKQQIKKQNENKKYGGIKPRYLQKRPIMRNVQQIQQNIYGRLKTQTEHIRRQRSMSREENQKKWDSFIKKNNQWGQAKQSNRIKAKITQNMRVNQQLNVRPPRVSPPKPTVDECLQKLRRQTQKLRQKLNNYTFEPKLYETERNKQKLSKQKQKKSRSRSPSPSPSPQNPRKLEEKQFTVIRNPKKELQFIFK